MSDGPYTYDRIRAGQERALDEREAWLGDCPYWTQTGDKVCNRGCWEEPWCMTGNPGWPGGNEDGWGPEPTGYQWEPVS